MKVRVDCKQLGIFACYFVLLMILGIFVRDVPEHGDLFSFTIPQMIETVPMGDSRSFGEGALDIVNHGWLTEDNIYIFKVWPPGFVFLEVAIIKIFGEDAPFMLVLLCLISVLLAFFMLKLYRTLSFWIPSKLAFILPMTLFAFPLTRYFFLQSYGLMLGENFAIAFFMLGVLYLLSAVQEQKQKDLIFAGIFIALAAYFRSQFELFLQALIWSGLLYCLFCHFFYKNKPTTQEKQKAKELMRGILTFIIVSVIVTLPWRAYRLIELGKMSWVHTGKITYYLAVTSPEKAGVLNRDGMGNLTCIIDPSTCDDNKNAKMNTIKTYLTNMPQWYALKLSVIDKFWFSPLVNRGGMNEPPTVADYVANSLFLFALIFSLAMCYVLRKSKFFPVLVALNFSIMSMYFVIITLVHYEFRYFYFIKIYALIMAILSATIFVNERKGNRIGADPD